MKRIKSIIPSPNSEPNPLRDRDIRKQLHGWLLERHQDDQDTNILHELPIPRPSARVDVAVVNGQLYGYEIKSDVDTLARLPQQVASFNSVFNQISIVVTRKHLHAVRKLVPAWWGILLFTNGAFKVHRNSKTNPQRQIEAGLHMLTREELFCIATTSIPGCFKKSIKKDLLIQKILDLGDESITQYQIRSVLKIRKSQYIDAIYPSSPSSSVPKSLGENII